jgi:hypothetical protein
LLPLAGDDGSRNQFDEQTRDAKPDKPAAKGSSEDKDSKAKNTAQDTHAAKE